MHYLRRVWICVFLIAGFAVDFHSVIAAEDAPAAAQQPVVPIGLDAYRQWERWPYQRIGARAYMRSTYDRRGFNEGADASHFLYQLADDFNVTLDVEGPGVLYFARYNHWHGSPWHYEVDGTDHIVQESSSANPLKPVPKSVFLPEKPFPAPLTFTWSTTKGADLMWVPIPFEDRFRMAYSRTCYGTGYYIYHQFVEGTPLSQPITTWDGKTPPATDVLELLNRSGSDLVPQPDTKAGKQLNMQAACGVVEKLSAGETVRLIDIDRAPAMLRALHLSIPRDQAEALENGPRLRITWDGREAPSVDAPIPLFFGAGSLYNRHDREHLVKAFPMNIRFDKERIHFDCYFPMPFFRSARIELVGGPQNDVTDLRWRARWMPFSDPPNHVGYFHATFQDHPEPTPGEDLVLLDTTKLEGGGDWSGQFVGTSFIFSHNGNLRTLEGDPRFFFDDSNTPQAYGTGTEEWGGGGDYWGGNTMTLPLAGHPVGAPDPRRGKPHNDRDKIESAYRFLLADLMPFGKNARIQLEHGGHNDSVEHYESVTYWYGLPAPALVQTDSLKIGDAASEAEHQYNSPDASETEKITSRYELGVDVRPGKKKGENVEVYPPHTDVGRTTKGTSEFTLQLRPDNLGVMLRRKLDYQYPNQRAEVSIADAKTPNDWQPAGVWYLAGSNTCVQSDPDKELGATQHNVQTSNRRFRDDEFLVPRKLTAGREAIRVRVKFTPVEVPLFPGHPLAELAWSEIRYDAYCFIMPAFDEPQIDAQAKLQASQ
ncbi:MAG: DUF2961 domain-containing protein [Pirellulales bacterium]